MILQMEIEKGKESHKDLEFFKGKATFDGYEYGHTTATTMRLVKPWFGTQRVLAADSWFASVKTAEALADNGLFFVGPTTVFLTFPKAMRDVYDTLPSALSEQLFGPPALA